MFDFGNERQASTKTVTIPPPSKGWIQSGNILRGMKDGAERLDNWFPTAQGAELRGGSRLKATVGAAVQQLVGYANGDQRELFAATATDVTDVTAPADAEVAEAPVIRGLTGADWSEVQFSTAGGVFTWMINGTDPAWYYDGTDWNPINTATVNDLTYDALSADFAVGQVVTGGTSGATATIVGIAPTSATAGVLKVGAITGTFSDNEALTDALTGAATSNIPSGTSVGSAITITGVAASALSQCWVFKERIFAVEKNTQSAWYLPVEAIGGAATEIPLGSVFSKGGNLLFGATWSLDSGSGLDDVCIFVSTTGEIAVYQGTDPASASTWALVGVYEIGNPLNKHSWFKAGGDLAILTEDGVVPVSEALQKDRGALQASALTYPIEDAWRDIVTLRDSAYPFNVTLWQAQSRVIIGTPDNNDGMPVSLVANARTGAWCRYLGWDVRCSRVLGDDLYFGTSSSTVMQAESGGDDNGVAYTGVYVPRFVELGGETILNRANLVVRSNTTFNFSVKGLSNYTIPDLSPPASETVASDPAAWGTAVWGTFVWGGSESSKLQRSSWKTVRAKGFAVSAAYQITVNQSITPDIEIMATRLRYEVGQPL